MSGDSACSGCTAPHLLSVCQPSSGQTPLTAARKMVAWQGALTAPQAPQASVDPGLSLASCPLSLGLCGPGTVYLSWVPLPWAALQAVDRPEDGVQESLSPAAPWAQQVSSLREPDLSWPGLASSLGRGCWFLCRPGLPIWSMCCPMSNCAQTTGLSPSCSEVAEQGRGRGRCP